MSSSKGAVVSASTAQPRAAQLRLLAGGAMARAWADLKPHVEQACGHPLEIVFGTTPNLIREATSGRPFDAAVVPADVMQDAAARARFVPGPTIDIARAGLGVAVRSGAPKPDIGTPDALKAALLAARSIATVPASATGYSIARVFARLGIAEAMTAKMRAQPGPAQVVEAVAGGDAELGLFLTHILAAPGLDVVGPFPAALQEHVVFTAAVAAQSEHAEAGRTLIDYLQGPTAVAIIAANGLTPG
jgi:molybdate transport system substrate-binding protein